jgi:predicted transposase/invertase (TIGR01784 family)
MIIANPLYDTAFKQLARDPEIAKAMIETLLETEVVEIALTESEHNKPMDADDKRPRFIRVDYHATVRDKSGTTQKILIEMQKGSGAENILRFREYLAVAGYMPKKDEKSPIPVVTVYFLGFKLQQVDTPCLKVARQYIDMLNKSVLETKEKFVELLTHDSYIIQAPRININKHPQTRLEKILSIFEQKNFIGNQEETINYEYPIDDNAVKKMADVLHYIGTDPNERKVLDEEAYWQRYDYYHAGALLRQQDELAEKDRELAEKDRELAEKDRELTETKRKVVLNLHNMGFGTADIAKAAEVSEKEVNEILK